MADGNRQGCLGTLLVWIASAVSVWLTAELMPGIWVQNFWPTAFWAAFAIGLVNVFVKPLLYLFTLPINLATLGLFSLFLNGLCLWLAARFIDGFKVEGFFAMVIGAVVLSVVSSIVGHLFRPREDDED